MLTHSTVRAYSLQPHFKVRDPNCLCAVGIFGHRGAVAITFDGDRWLLKSAGASKALGISKGRATALPKVERFRMPPVFACVLGTHNRAGPPD